MNALWQAPAGAPTVTVIDLLEKNKKAGPKQALTVEDVVRYMTRTLGLDRWSGADIEALAAYMAREGAAWSDGANFHSKKFTAMIKELEVAARSCRRGNPFGLLVISTSKNDLPVADQMEKLKKAGSTALQLLQVGNNRAFFAIHDDTDNLHLHIIYCRYDSSGRLTEREAGRFRRYLLEDVTARIAFDLGYGLEGGAKTLPDRNGDLVDKTSGQIVRTAAFEPDLAGCKARNRERAKLRTGHRLEQFALEALQKGLDLTGFRAFLAVEGVRYVNSGKDKAGGGAVFIEPDGTCHRASKVNRRLSRGKIFNGSYKNGLPLETRGVIDMLHGVTASHTPAAGTDAPNYAGELRLTEDQRVEADRRLKLGYSDGRPGRPRKNILDNDWPHGFAWGGIRAPTAAAAAFHRRGIIAKDRSHHVELWREQQLIAVQRQDQIVIYTRDKEDLRALLLAAHEQWGTVQLTGNTTFKKRMADMAAELNVPIANADLQSRIARRRRELKHAGKNASKGEIETSLPRGHPNATKSQEGSAASGQPGSKSAEDRVSPTAPVVSEPAEKPTSSTGEHAAVQSKLDWESAQPTSAPIRNRTDGDVVSNAGGSAPPDSQSNLDVPARISKTPSGQRSAVATFNGTAASSTDGKLSNESGGTRPGADMIAKASALFTTGAPPLSSADKPPAPSLHRTLPVTPGRSDSRASAARPVYSKAQANSPESPYSSPPCPRELPEQALRDIDQFRKGLRPTMRDGRAIFLLEDCEAQHMRLSDADQLGTQTQERFRLLYERQEQEHRIIIEALDDGVARVRSEIDLMGRTPPSYHLQATDSGLTELFRAHYTNAGLQSKLAGAFAQQEYSDAQRKLDRERLQQLGCTASSTEIEPIDAAAQQVSRPITLKATGAKKSVGELTQSAPRISMPEKVSGEAQGGRPDGPAKSQDQNPHLGAKQTAPDSSMEKTASTADSTDRNGAPDEATRLWEPRDQARSRGAAGPALRESEAQATPKPSAAPSALLENQANEDSRSKKITPFDRLIARVRGKLGPERWPDWAGSLIEFKQMPKGPERDRRAYVLSRTLAVPVVERPHYPELAELFTCSDRNLHKMRAQQMGVSPNSRTKGV